MTFHRRTRRKGDDNSALSDLAFLLIIYFIVIAGFNENKGFLLSLPKKDSVKTVQMGELLRFELDAAGALFLDGKVLTRAEAETHIARMVSEHPNLAVVLHADAETPWQYVVGFVEIAQKLKVDSFSFLQKKSIEHEGGV
ncbi:MAG: hypothetical protein Ta2A_25050 [Treponemataceae bacterium]|nr:MAG: hypothetical protein Ta2A_25050 [Treponemataceae bacterium]